MERLTRLVRLREGWLMVGLLALMLFSVTWSVQKAEWAEGLRILSPVTLIGLFTGLILCKIRGVPRVLLHATGLAAGALAVLWFTANLSDDPNLPSIQDKTQALLSKTVGWFSAVATGDMSDDIWVFVLALAVLSFALAYVSTWFLFRSRWLWWALVPNGIALLVNISYSSQSGLGLFFILYMISALLLMVRFNMLLHEERWDRERVNYSPNLRWSFLWVSSLFAAAVAVAMWFVPPQAVNNTLNGAWEQINGPWVEFQLRFSRAFSGVNGGGNFGYSSFNSSFALGGSLTLGDSITLRVKSDRPLYWRAVTYDNWNGIGWTDTAGSTFHRPNISSKLSLDANQELLSTDQARQAVTMTVTVVQPKVNENGPIVFAPLRPVKASLPTRLDVSWAEKNKTYQVPGTDPNGIELEMRPLVTLLADARREAIQKGQAPTGIGDENFARSVLGAIGRDGDVSTEISRLHDRGIQVSYEIGMDFTFVVRANGPFPEYDDIMAVYAHDRMERGAQYTIVSMTSLGVVPAPGLRTAGTSYPDWVRQRYLQLPATLPSRVNDLAHQIVSDAQAENPYDVAVAVQNYLRDNYKYSTNIRMPPPSVDKVDYFLFEQKTGYCEYYSSAMVVMLRTLGIPAREATGYAPGEQDKESGEFVIRESSSHAWPEVYFPTYGWIEFEPTPSQAAIIRPETNEVTSATPPATQGPDDAISQLTRPANDPLNELSVTPASGGFGGFLDSAGRSPGTVAGGLFLLGGGLLGLVWLLRRRAQQRAWAAGLVTATGSTYYERLVRLAWWLGVRPRPAETPFEFAEAVGREVPNSRPYVASIAQAYVNERWGRRKLGVVDQIQLERAWGEVRRGIVRRMSNTRAVLARLRSSRRPGRRA